MKDFKSREDFAKVWDILWFMEAMVRHIFPFLYESSIEGYKESALTVWMLFLLLFLNL